MKYAVSLFLVLISFLPLTSQIDPSDSLALVDLYNSLDGDNWENNDQWLTGPVDDWHGVYIRNNRVDRLLLSNNGLSGSIPESISDMDALTEVYFGSDDILMPLPDMSGLVNLERLYLFDINMDTLFPEVIRSLSSLNYLNLGQCHLRGPLPSWLPELSNLERLELSTNNLEGDLIMVLRNMPQLKSINVFGNDFFGPLPDFSIFEGIEELVIGRNDFTGPFPEWVIQLDSLTYLHLGDCDLSGKLPDHLFSRMSQDLRQFVISGNNFTGDIQNALDAYMPNVYRFEIGSNNFTGVIPDGVLDVNRISKWAVAYNELSGIPDFMSLPLDMAWFYNSDNKLGFQELESCLNIMVTRPNRLTLGPQKPLLDVERLHPDLGEIVMLYSGSGGQYSQHQWYKDSMPIPDATDEDFIIESYTPKDDGEYYCVITNDSFAFDLVRSPVYIGNIVGTMDHHNISLEVFPNPSHGSFTISMNGNIDHFSIHDQSGRLIKKVEQEGEDVFISGFDPGIYLVRASGTQGSGTTQIVVSGNGTK